eukprot:gene5606-9250_t
MAAEEDEWSTSDAMRGMPPAPAAAGPPTLTLQAGAGTGWGASPLPEGTDMAHAAAVPSVPKDGEGDLHMGETEPAGPQPATPQPLLASAAAPRGFTMRRLTAISAAVGTAQWPAADDVVDALLGAADFMKAEGVVVAARPARDRPLRVFGALRGDCLLLAELLRAGAGPDGSRWLFLGGYVGSGPQGLRTLVLVTALKCVTPLGVRLLRGASEQIESPAAASLMEEVTAHYGPQEAARIRFAMQSAFADMPWVARLRGASIASPSGYTCVADVDVKLQDLGTGDAAERDRQWAAVAMGTIAPPQARTRRGADGAWVIGREELAAGLRRSGKQLLIRTGPLDEVGVVELGGRQRAATLPQGRCFSDSLDMPEPHCLPLQDAFKVDARSYAPGRLLTCEPALGTLPTQHLRGDDVRGGGGDPAMEAEPDPDVARADALLGGHDDEHPREDGFPPSVDLAAHLPQLEDVDVLHEMLHRVPTLRRVPWSLRPYVRQAIVSAFTLAKPRGRQVDMR